MNRFLLIVGLLFCCNIEAAQLPPAHSLSPLVVLPALITNVVHLRWNPSPDAASYVVLYGTNAGTWTQSKSIPQGSNYDLTIITPRKSKWWITLKSADAQGRLSTECNTVYWLPLPPPPFNAVELSWTMTRTVTVEQSTDLRSWGVVTNLTGTNVVFDKRTLPTFYRLQSVVPAIKVKIRGVYK